MHFWYWYVSTGILWVIIWMLSDFCRDQRRIYGQVSVGTSFLTTCFYLIAAALSVFPLNPVLAIEALIGFFIGLLCLVRA